MIFGKLNNLARYRGLGEHLDTAIDFLAHTDLSTLSVGKTVINGENVFVNRFDYDTVPENIIEGHLDYIDIHIVLSGEERVGVADVTDLCETERKPDEDFIGLSGSFTSENILHPGDFLLVFPEDAHSPKLCLDAPCAMRKAVVKVLDARKRK